MNDDQIANWAHKTMGQTGTLRVTRQQLADQNEAMLLELQQLRREASHQGDVSYIALRNRAIHIERSLREANLELGEHRSMRSKLGEIFQKYKVGSAARQTPDQTVETILQVRDALATKVPAQATEIRRLNEELARSPSRSRRLRERGSVSMGQEYWIWEDRLPNNLDTVRTPIIIQPAQLRALLKHEVTQREDAYKQTRLMRDERDEWKRKFTSQTEELRRLRRMKDSTERAKEGAFDTLRRLGVSADEAYSNFDHE